MTPARQAHECSFLTHDEATALARPLSPFSPRGAYWALYRQDQLVAAAGFEKIEQRIDEWGIFTVSLARRVAP